MKKIVLLLLLLCAHPVLAVTPFIITDIRVEGLERLEAGTIFNYLPLKVGDELNDEEARLSIKELFSTGFFKDVALEQDGTVLVVKVVERPSISELEITGNKVLDSAAIEDVLEQVGLVQGRIFNSASLDRVEQELKNTYLSLGRYSATVESEVEELDRNRVAIRLKVNEGRVATIKKINIIGAKAIPVKKIIAEMSLRDTRGFLSGRDQYSKQKLEADIEAIRSYYLDRGFHDFKIADRSVDISPNKQSIFISISLVEGVRYVFGETVFEVADETPVTDLEKLVTIESGEPFSRKVVNASRVAITQKYADAGYAFVDVRPIYEADPDAQVVKTVFVIEPKQRVYVRKVEITGNLHTRDQVIRRELRQFEGSWYSASRGEPFQKPPATPRLFSGCNHRDADRPRDHRPGGYESRRQGAQYRRDFFFAGLFRCRRNAGRAGLLAAEFARHRAGVARRAGHFRRRPHRGNSLCGPVSHAGRSQQGFQSLPASGRHR